MQSDDDATYSKGCGQGAGMKYKKFIISRLKKFRKENNQVARSAYCPFNGLIDHHKYCAVMFPRWAKEFTEYDGEYTSFKNLEHFGILTGRCPCERMTHQHIRQTVEKILNDSK